MADPSGNVDIGNLDPAASSVQASVDPEDIENVENMEHMNDMSEQAQASGDNSVVQDHEEHQVEQQSLDDGQQNDGDEEDVHEQQIQIEQEQQGHQAQEEVEQLEQQREDEQQHHQHHLQQQPIQDLQDDLDQHGHHEQHVQQDQQDQQDQQERHDQQDQHDQHDQHDQQEQQDPQVQQDQLDQHNQHDSQDHHSQHEQQDQQEQPGQQVGQEHQEHQEHQDQQNPRDEEENQQREQQQQQQQQQDQEQQQEQQQQQQQRHQQHQQQQHQQQQQQQQQQQHQQQHQQMPPPPPPLPMGATSSQPSALVTSKVPRLKKRCLCDRDMCKVLTSVFSQLGDIRGGFVELPSKDAKNQRELNTFSRTRWLAALGISEDEVQKGKDKRLSKAHFSSSRFDGKRLVRWKPATNVTPPENLFTKDLKDYEITVPEISEAEMRSMLDQYMIERIVIPMPDDHISELAGSGGVDTMHQDGSLNDHHGNPPPPPPPTSAYGGLGPDSHDDPSAERSGAPPMPPSEDDPSGDGTGQVGHEMDEQHHSHGDSQGNPGGSDIHEGSDQTQDANIDGMQQGSQHHVMHGGMHPQSIVKSQYSVLASALNRRRSGPTTIQLLDVGQGAIKELHATRRSLQEMERENKQLKAEVQRLTAALDDRIEAGERIAKTLRREISVLETKYEALMQKSDKDRDRLDRYKRRLDDLNTTDSAAPRSKKRMF